MEIRCKKAVKYDTPNPFRDSTNILTFPTGEVDYAIYRGANGSTEDLYFQGLAAGEIESDVYGIKDTLDRAEPDVTGEIRSVYAPKESSLSSVAQAIYNNPTYAKCVKSQIQTEKYRLKTPEQAIAVSTLKTFIRKWVTNDSFNQVSNFESLRDRLLQTNTAVFKICFQESAKLDIVLLGKDTPENFTKAFFSEVISEEKLRSYRESFLFNKTDKLETGALVDLKLNACDGTGNIQQNNSLAVQGGNILDFLSSEEGSFSYSQSVNSINPRQIVFRQSAIDSFQTGKSFRYGNDVRLKDFKVDEYNTEQFTDPD